MAKPKTIITRLTVTLQPSIGVFTILLFVTRDVKVELAVVRPKAQLRLWIGGIQLERVDVASALQCAVGSVVAPRANDAPSTPLLSKVLLHAIGATLSHADLHTTVARQPHGQQCDGDAEALEDYMLICLPWQEVRFQIKLGALAHILAHSSQRVDHVARMPHALNPRGFRPLAEHNETRNELQIFERVFHLWLCAMALVAVNHLLKRVTSRDAAQLGWGSLVHAIRAIQSCGTHAVHAERQPTCAHLAQILMQCWPCTPVDDACIIVQVTHQLAPVVAIVLPAAIHDRARIQQASGMGEAWHIESKAAWLCHSRSSAKRRASPSLFGPHRSPNAGERISAIRPCSFFQRARSHSAVKRLQWACVTTAKLGKLSCSGLITTTRMKPASWYFSLQEAMIS
eukprot:7382258-Prymnesium_polylepis.5